jgi:membrane dipeptidase
MQQGTKSVGKNPMPDSYQSLSGLESPDKMRNISNELQKRGYKNEDIVKIMGGNWLKLFEKVWN